MHLDPASLLQLGAGAATNTKNEYEKQTSDKPWSECLVAKRESPAGPLLEFTGAGTSLFWPEAQNRPALALPEAYRYYCSKPAPPRQLVASPHSRAFERRSLCSAGWAALYSYEPTCLIAGLGSKWEMRATCCNR